MFEGVLLSTVLPVLLSLVLIAIVAYKRVWVTRPPGFSSVRCPPQAYIATPLHQIMQSCLLAATLGSDDVKRNNEKHVENVSKVLQLLQQVIRLKLSKVTTLSSCSLLFLSDPLLEC